MFWCVCLGPWPERLKRAKALHDLQKFPVLRMLIMKGVSSGASHWRDLDSEDVAKDYRGVPLRCLRCRF